MSQPAGMLLLRRSALLFVSTCDCSQHHTSSMSLRSLSDTLRRQGRMSQPAGMLLLRRSALLFASTCADLLSHRH